MRRASPQSDVEPALERLIDSALAAQEARHKAEMEQEGKARRAAQDQALHLAEEKAEAESKLREAKEREKTLREALTDAAIPTLRYCERVFGIKALHRQACEDALAAIRSGPAPTTHAEKCKRCAGTGDFAFDECSDCGATGVVDVPGPDQQAAPKAARCGRCELHKIGMPTPGYPHAEDCPFARLAATDPPEQETPKPGEPTSLDEHAFVRCELQDERQCTAWRKCHHPECLALGLLDDPIHASAPPVHGGGE